MFPENFKMEKSDVCIFLQQHHHHFLRIEGSKQDSLSSFPL